MCQTWPSCCPASSTIVVVVAVVVVVVVRQGSNVSFHGSLPLASAGVGGLNKKINYNYLDLYIRQKNIILILIN